MKRKRHTTDQNIKILRSMDKSVGQGTPKKEAVRSYQLVEQTYYRWKRP